jgi:hypothetical protein
MTLQFNRRESPCERDMRMHVAMTAEASHDEVILVVAASLTPFDNVVDL